MPNTVQILCPKNWMKVFSFPGLIPLGSEEIKSFKGYGGDHIAFRPTHLLVKWVREGFWQRDVDHVIDQVCGRTAGQGNNGAKPIAERQTRRDNNGRSTFDHFWRAESAKRVIAKQDRSWADRKLNRHPNC